MFPYNQQQQQSHFQNLGVPNQYLAHLLPPRQIKNQPQHQQQQQYGNHMLYSPHHNQENFLPCLNGIENSMVTESKYFLTKNGPLGTHSQSEAASAYFAKTNKTVSVGPKRVKKQDSDEKSEHFPTNFRTLVHKSPPQVPSALIRKLESLEAPSGLGKIRVVVRVARAVNCFDPHQQQEHRRHFQMDVKKKQVTLYDPSVFRGLSNGDELALEERRLGVAAPKMFAFDALFSSEDSHENLSTAVLPDVIQSVVNGTDGCIFCYGHANLGKTRTMLGSDECSRDMGVIPIAIAWLYKAIKERKGKAKFSLRVSALEITSQKEEVRDLLAPYETPDNDQAPGAYLRSLPVGNPKGGVLQTQCELRASSAEKAAYFLDAALAGRSLDAQGRESHLVFTIHVYQCSMNQTSGGRSASSAVLGGRSRLHLIDFGGCERTKTSGGGITLSGLGNVILGIFNGQKHLPCKDSKVTQVLKECLGSLTCQATMLAHVSPEASHYSETLHTVQLASRLHRMRRKRLKANSGHGSASSDEHRRLSKLRSRSSSSGRSSSDFTSGTSTNASSSEVSCDTVVYRGHSDGSGTDSEHPPVFLPNLRFFSSGGSSGGSSAPGSLRGSLDEIPRPRRRTSGSKILTNGAIASPRRNLSPQPSLSHIVRSPNRSLSSLPVIHEVNTNSRNKMPLNGLVPVQGRQRMRDNNNSHDNPHSPVINNQTNNLQMTPTSNREQWVDMSPNNNNFQPPLHKNNFGHNERNFHSFSDLKEVWVDGDSNICPQNQSEANNFNQRRSRSSHNFSNNNSGKKYGFMDEHKVNMISSWVETQKQEQHQQSKGFEGDRNSFRALTQFKTCDNNMMMHLNGNVIVHEEPNYVNNNNYTRSHGTKCPPPPPPRRTPPKETSTILNLVEECNNLARTLPNEDNGMRYDENRAKDISYHIEQVKKAQEHRMNKQGIQRAKSEEPNPELEHPLRILSEENLTVVSSFAASLNDLTEINEHDQVDPSKLSFFEVPDFTSIKDDMEKQDNFISERFKQFAQLERNINSDKDKNTKEQDDPLPQQEVLLTFKRDEVKKSREEVRSANENKKQPPTASVNPQKQFQLLAENLRHPDGSSNPELNLPERRSPGNGISTSDAEDSPDDAQSKQVDPSPTQNPRFSKKESSRFSFRFLKIFGSSKKLNKSNDLKIASDANKKRSKSCDRKTDPHQVHPAKSSFFRDGFMRGSMRSATSSPSIKTTSSMPQQQQKQHIVQSPAVENPEMSDSQTTPSNLSISTEWEYQDNEEQEEKDIQNENDQKKVFKMTKSFYAKQNYPLVRTDRKSSGYDSLGGESSSLDSNEDPVLKEKLLRCETLNYNGKVNEIPYAIPNDLQIIQYDEVDILRMEQRSKFASFAK